MHNEDWRVSPRSVKGGPIRADFTYEDGSSESHSITKNDPRSPAKYIAGNQDGPVPEGVKITAKPRASGVLRRKFEDHLNQMLAEEYINQEEHDARHALMLKAETDAELRVLIADLPGIPAPQEPEPKLTWAKVKQDIRYNLAKFWRGSAGTVTKAALLTLSFIGSVTVGVLPATILLAGVKHPNGLAAGLATVAIVSGVIWFIANIVGLVFMIDGS